MTNPPGPTPDADLTEVTVARAPAKRRLWLEGMVIVISILLAFAIEAGWAELVEAREARRLAELIRDDVVATEAEVARQRTRSQELAGRARHLLETLASPRATREQLSEALLTLGSIFVTGSWAPVDHTYVEALNSGRLRLIEDEELRLALTRYHAQIEELDGIFETVEEQYYGQLEPFMVAHTVYSEIAAEWWRGSLVGAPFATDFEALAKSRELWNLLTLRLEIEVAVQSRLDRMDELTQLVLGLLPLTP